MALHIKQLSAIGATALLLFVSGCAMETERAPGQGRGEDTSNETTEPTTPEDASTDEQAPPTGCDHGTVTECVVYLPTNNGIVQCMDGVRVCDKGSWSVCMAPEIAEEELERLSTVSPNG